MRIKSSAGSHRLNYLSIIFIFILLYISSRYSFLLFHCLAEIFSVFVAFGIFTVAWNVRRYLDNNYLLFIGIAYLFIGGIDLIHTLSYKGMAVFGGYGPNLPTQLWIAARYMESVSLLIAPFLLHRTLKINRIFIIYLVITVGLVAAIFSGGFFPDCFVEGKGLTPFKKASEYLISIILFCSVMLVYYNRSEFSRSVYQQLIASIILTIFAELAFTFYIEVYGLSNLIGHFLKIISFYLIYKAIIETGLVRPYEVLFRNLQKSEGKLRRERDQLQHALDEIKTLRGILPICANCKKIRDDAGYWTQIEAYIKNHSEADFSHSICPGCAKELYPNIKVFD